MPVLMQILCEYHNGDRVSYPTLRLTLLSGDQIPLTLSGQMYEWLNETMNIINLGGATEYAIWSVYHPIGEMESTWTSIPYDRSLRSQPVYVLNAQLGEYPVRVEEEICIDGTELAQGYLNNAEKTAASFIWREASSERICRTGDRGCYFADEQVAFLGCNDTQARVDDYHIELGKVKGHLEQFDNVGNAAVVYHQGQLYTFITVAENLHPDDTDALLARAHARLAAQLPYYLLPQRLFLFKALPMTDNGKIDQAAMVQGVIQHVSRSTSQESRALVHAPSYEQQVATPWCKVLQRKQIGLNDNFFEAGGGLIQIVLLYHRIEEIFKVTVPIAELFHLTAVRRITGHLQAMQDNTRAVNRTQQCDASRSRTWQRLVHRHQRQR